MPGAGRRRREFDQSAQTAYGGTIRLCVPANALKKNKNTGERRLRLDQIPGRGR